MSSNYQPQEKESPPHWSFRPVQVIALLIKLRSDLGQLDAGFNRQVGVNKFIRLKLQQDGLLITRIEVLSIALLRMAMLI